jgi:two-component system phosphate regulon sensor histidine kinase PhoR
MLLALILAGVVGVVLLYSLIPSGLLRPFIGGVYIALLAGLAGLIISRRICRPLDEITIVIEDYSRGKLDRRLPTWDTLEFDRLANSVNKMAFELDSQIRAISDRHNEQEAVFLSMMEGILAFDTRERLININNAAVKMLGLEMTGSVGRYMQEVIRNIHLQKFISRALKSREPIEDEIMLQAGTGRVVLAGGSVLRGQREEVLGALIVLNDITRLRQLENIRREFVANVSHELKTPITSIKGFVETLRDGAMNSPEDAKRFLGIVARQTDRLNSIIEDLLSLAKIEEGTEKRQIALESGKVKNVLSAAIQSCEHRAKEKGITVQLKGLDDIKANINPQLLEQALVNLIDNAIKYSDSGQSIEVGCGRADDEIVLEVRDYGCGIEKDHLPRLFERFYRADKARSREQGGTGLGLAIVKHIALAHGGTVSVESNPGQGSVFRIHLPLPFYSRPQTAF